MVDRSRFIKYTDQDIVRCYTELKSSAKVAKHLGIGGTTVERILTRNKVTRDGRDHYLKNSRAYTDEIEAEIIKKYIAGVFTTDLIKEYGGSSPSIDKVLLKHGIEKRPDTAPLLKPDELEKIKQLLALGWSHLRISLELNRTQKIISHAAKSLGFRYIRAKKDNHGNWKGGKIRVGNYTCIRMDEDDPYFSMGHSGGYVMEHRIVMARHLGRCLTRHETVHHINGDGTDNRIENLQLRQGRHGKGAVAYCLDCGSHNIGHKPLSEKAA